MWRHELRFRGHPAQGRRAQGLRPPHHLRRAPDGPRTRLARPARGHAEPHAHRHAGDRLRDPLLVTAPGPGDRLAARLRLQRPGHRPLPRQHLLPARHARRGLPPDPVGHGADRAARHAAGDPRVRQEAARHRARNGPDRLRQVHDAGLADQRDQRDARPAHPHDRGPDRVPAPPQALPRQPARARPGRTVLRGRPEGRAAPGPRRDPRGRDARHGDDRHGPDRRRDRPPRLRHAPHAGRPADRGPDHRRLPARPAGPDPRAARDRPPGHRHPDAPAHGRRHRPLRGRRGARAHAGRAQPHPRGQDAPDLLADPDGRRAGHADDGRFARRARARRQDHDGHRGEPLLAAGGAPPAPARCPAGDERRLMGAATWTYKAVDGMGVPSKGEVAGASKDAVTEQLKERGLKVMELAEKKTALNMEISLFKRVKATELTVMTRQLATMITSGMTLLRAFYVLEDQIENKLLKETVGAVREDIESGLAFSEGLAKHPKIFNPLYVSMVRAGETGGVLEEALDRISDQLEKDDALRRQVKSAMAYPVVVLSFALCVLIGLIAFIVPVFVGVFKEFGGELPLITKLTVAMSHAVTSQWYFLIAGAVGGTIGFKKWRTSKAGRPQWDRLRLKIPFKIGDTVKKIALARWSRTFAALYSAGVPIMQAIEVTGQTAGNAMVEKAMADVIESVKSGGSIAAPLKEAPTFTGMVAQMIAVGEETGNLDAMLSKVADFYEDEVAAAVKALTSILEPVMIILVGGIVGFIVIAMYMPMFKVYDAIK